VLIRRTADAEGGSRMTDRRFDRDRYGYEDRENDRSRWENDRSRYEDDRGRYGSSKGYQSGDRPMSDDRSRYDQRYFDNASNRGYRQDWDDDMSYRQRGGGFSQGRGNWDEGQSYRGGGMSQGRGNWDEGSNYRQQGGSTAGRSGMNWDDQDPYRQRGADQGRFSQGWSDDLGSRLGGEFGLNNRSQYDYDQQARRGMNRQGGFSQGPQTGRGPKGYQRSDDRIKEEICECLTQHGQIDASDVDVKVQNGEAILTGTVDSRSTKRMIDDALDGISGLKDIQNNVRINQQSNQTTTQQSQTSQTEGQTGLKERQVNR